MINLFDRFYILSANEYDLTNSALMQLFEVGILKDEDDESSYPPEDENDDKKAE